jgi:hypothetical protein
MKARFLARIDNRDLAARLVPPPQLRWRNAAGHPLSSSGDALLGLPEFPAGVKDPLIEPPLPPPSGAEYNENRVFSPQHGQIGRYDPPIVSVGYESKFVTWRINRISMEFSRRITNSNGLSIEKQWKSKLPQKIDLDIARDKTKTR